MNRSTRTLWLCLVAGLWMLVACRTPAPPAGPSARAAPCKPLECRSMAGGGEHSLARDATGQVWAWGENEHGQLGDGTTADHPTPVRVSGLEDVAALSAGHGFSLALKSDGTLWTWGRNTLGQLGDGTTTNHITPVRVAGLGGVKAVATGRHHTLALTSDGTVWSWGGNYAGEVGDGSMTPRATPAQVPGLAGVVAVAAGKFHSLALKADGTVWAWGGNYDGQLGGGTPNETSATPVQVPGLRGVVALATGDSHAVAVKSDGTVWAWGSGHLGQLGNGRESSSGDAPAQVPGLSDVVAVAAGVSHSLVLKADGTLWAWGNNAQGQLGAGSASRTLPSPIQVTGLRGVVAVAAGEFHSLARMTDGSLWVWGNNYSGQLGQVRPPQAGSPPVQVARLEGLVAVAAGTRHSLAARFDGSVWSWGHNEQGQLGDGSKTERTSPVRVAGPSSVVAVAAGARHSLAIESSGALWAWGHNDYGQLGIEPRASDATSPVQVARLGGVVTGAAGDEHSLALTSDGGVWAWGNNRYGQLGDGSTKDSDAPVRVAGLDGVVAVAAGAAHSLALKRDGTLWGWGHNYYGQLGDGTTTNRTRPVQVAGLASVKALAAGGSTSFAVKADGTLWAWGDNTWCQLGAKALNPSLRPAQVPGLAGVKALATGGVLVLATKPDGGLWNWGAARSCQDESTGSATPVGVPGLSDVRALAAGEGHSLALKSDGTLWAWGDNTWGQRGDETASYIPAPVPLVLPPRAAGR